MNFADRDGKIWFDGQMVPWREAKVHVLTHTLHYGMGIFEGIRAYETPQGPAVFRLPEHIQRFCDGAKILNMTMPYDQQTLLKACVDILAINQLTNAYIRPMCFYGAEGMGLRADNLQVHVIIAAWEWGAYLGEENLKKGIRIRTSTYRRINTNSLHVKAKANGHYINSMLALQEAQMTGYDEALLLDDQGYVAEGSGENFFMIRDGIVYTPPAAAILEGITRRSIFNLCDDLGIKVVEKLFTRDDVYTADEAFFTGTAAEVIPIRELDGRTINKGERGPITQKIQRYFFDTAKGQQDKRKEWLTLL